MKKQKPSGSQNRKRKRDSEQNIARLSGSLTKFLTTNPPNSSLCDNPSYQKEIDVEKPSSHNPSSHDPSDLVIGKKHN